jgi:hypothetical protein
MFEKVGYRELPVAADNCTATSRRVAVARAFWLQRRVIKHPIYPWLSSKALAILLHAFCRQLAGEWIRPRQHVLRKLVGPRLVRPGSRTMTKRIRRIPVHRALFQGRCRASTKSAFAARMARAQPRTCRSKRHVRKPDAAPDCSQRARTHNRVTEFKTPKLSQSRRYTL